MVDLDPFLAAGRLLYDGPWVAERLAAVGDFAERHPGLVHPVTLQMLRSGHRFDAVDAFRGLYRLRELRAQTAPAWAAMDVLAVPTVPTTFTVAEMLADPIHRNTVLGTYTTFANLLDLAAIGAARRAYRRRTAARHHPARRPRARTPGWRRLAAALEPILLRRPSAEGGGRASG